jgi:hypothetical protein
MKPSVLGGVESGLRLYQRLTGPAPKVIVTIRRRHKRVGVIVALANRYGSDAPRHRKFFDQVLSIV